ncbi:VQ motif-containing protein 4 [Punica granatum]|uniref:VQ domain-containing protein n=2 Tax=Punica granatum TaxID=22663 RepID=A0A218WXD6_PUNGR|nr:VQ motif-containing protein 4 [Punica granatum]OWM77447.1 hypothetical protein CDL15_Pgr016844 [Punica granatum]PKI51237.1 hypothetical protein CRG98_028385 [Punica granatum]
MEVSQSHHESASPTSLLPSPTSHSSTSSSSTTTTTTNTAPGNPNPNGPPNQNGHPQQCSPRPVTRSEPANPYPTTFVQADTSSFKQVVQMLTGSSKPDQPSPPTQQLQQQPPAKHHHHSIPPIKTIPKKSGSGSGFKLYERRNSLKSLKINPLGPFPGQLGSGASPRNPEILSPSILDFPALVLSPVTPLTHDPFARSPRPPYDSLAESPSLDPEAEEKAIREKGFFLHPSPASTPRDPEPRLLPLFPLSSPRVSGSSPSN